MDTGAKSGEKAGRRGSDVYLDELESLKAVAGDDVDILEAARPAVMF
jgi:hypothetical protein